jgi:hypothetical protein
MTTSPGVAPFTPLVRPSEYFDPYDRPSMAVAAVVVAVQALGTAVAMWLFLQRVIAHVDAPPAEKAQVRSALGGAIVGVFVAIFVGWLLLAALLHLFVWFAGGQRSFGTTLAVTGEAELAGIVLLPVTTVGLISLLGQAPLEPGGVRRLPRAGGLVQLARPAGLQPRQHPLEGRDPGLRARRRPRPPGREDARARVRRRDLRLPAEPDVTRDLPSAAQRS